jgi:hypothetical protein
VPQRSCLNACTVLYRFLLAGGGPASAVLSGPNSLQAKHQASTTAGHVRSAGSQPSGLRQLPLDAIHTASDSLRAPQHTQAQLQSYKPFINAQGLWELSELDLEAIAVGAQILGAGGGGSARLNRLKLQHAMAQRAAAAASAPIAAAAAAAQGAGAAACQACRIRPCVLSLAGLQDDAMLCDVGGMGAPTVSAEKLDSHECAAAVRGLEGSLPSPLTALLCAEVGGGNALEPLAVGMELGLPIVDADLMGRAFPELQMSTAAIAGVSLTPAAIADDKGNVLVMAAAASANWAEKVLRAACTEMGCSVGLASSPMSGRHAQEVRMGCCTVARQLPTVVSMLPACLTDNKSDPANPHVKVRRELLCCCIAAYAGPKATVQSVLPCCGCHALVCSRSLYTEAALYKSHAPHPVTVAATAAPVCS